MVDRQSHAPLGSKPWFWIGCSPEVVGQILSTFTVSNVKGKPRSNSFPWCSILGEAFPSWSDITCGSMIRCWWFWNPSPVEVGSLSHYLQDFIHPRWLAGFLPSTVVCGFKVLFWFLYSDLRSMRKWPNLTNISFRPLKVHSTQKVIAGSSEEHYSVTRSFHGQPRGRTRIIWQVSLEETN